MIRYVRHWLISLLIRENAEAHLFVVTAFMRLFTASGVVGGRASASPPEFPWLVTGGSLTLDRQPPAFANTR